VPPLLTVGHGQLDAEALLVLLQGAGVACLVDVRRFPASRRSPTLARESLEVVLPAGGVDYRWEERLGGRRRLPDDDSQDPWWQVDAFRAYAAHTRTAEFRDALAEVLADERRTAVMCSESVWWRCHRRLIADVATVGHGLDVLHLMPDGSLRPHRPAEGARPGPERTVVWDRLEP
jgi:uncharacterized protein (DUF488 family)